MKIEMFTSMFEVRSMCIKHDYCTMMDNAEYDKMQCSEINPFRQITPWTQG